MEFKHDKSWDILTDVLNTGKTAKEAWKYFIEFHEQIVPKPYWKKLKQIEIEEEQADIIDWITTIVTNKPVPKKIVAIWIGLLKFGDDNENEIPTLYLGGSDKYDNDNGDWACDLKYLPENRYAQPCLLQEIDLIAKTDNDNYEFLDWILPLAYCAFTFDEVFRTKIDKTLFLKYRDKLFISVGYDSGDYIDLKPIA